MLLLSFRSFGGGTPPSLGPEKNVDVDVLGKEEDCATVVSPLSLCSFIERMDLFIAVLGPPIEGSVPALRIVLPGADR